MYKSVDKYIYIYIRFYQTESCFQREFENWTTEVWLPIGATWEQKNSFHLFVNYQSICKDM